ncbi:MAG: type VI secretion system baseplate subunit TssG [Bilophila sp.]
MAAEIRRTPSDLEPFQAEKALEPSRNGGVLDSNVLSRFRAAPWRFDVWQASAMLEAWKERMDWGVPASDTIPTGQVRGVAFPEEDASRLEDDPPRLDVNLFGLVSMDGPLPPHMALLVRERSREGDPAFQDFLDLFHNRLLCLWRDMASSLCPELWTDTTADASPHTSQAGHPFAVFLEAISGLPHTGERSRTLSMPGPVRGQGDVPAWLFRSCAAVWGRQPRSAAGLEKLVQAAFGVQAQVTPFCGAWVAMPDASRTRLGRKDADNARLGTTALLGHRMFDATAGITLHLAPLTETQRRMFLPPPAGTLRANLLALVRWYLGDVRCELVLGINK